MHETVESQKDPVGLRKSRIVFMKKLIEIKNHYKDSEKELHDRMDPSFTTCSWD